MITVKIILNSVTEKISNVLVTSNIFGHVRKESNTTETLISLTTLDENLTSHQNS